MAIYLSMTSFIYFGKYRYLKMKIQLNMQPCMDVTFSCRHKQMRDGAEAMTREENKNKRKR